jgi:hypothetical protein
MSLSVKDASGATQTVNTLPALGQAAAAASLPAVLASDGNHAKAADIAALQSTLTAALATLATDADAQTIAAKLEAIRLLLAGTVAVSAQALPLPGGAATSAKQDAAATILTNILTALGPLATDADLTQGFASVVAKDEAIRALLAGTLQVAAQSLPLPNGAATDAKLELVRALLSGTLAISAASLPLPAGAATAAAQGTGNASLASIATALAGILGVSATDGALATVGAKADAAAAFGAASASLVALLKNIATAEAPFQGAIALTAGTPGTAGRALRVNCTVAGNITLTYADGSTDTVPVNVGLSYLPGAITTAAIPGSGGATATFANMK